MKVDEIRKKTKTELGKQLLKERETLRKLRFDLASGKVKNVREIRNLRKEIARIFTILKEK